VTATNDAPTADDETFNGANSAVGNTTLVGNAPGDGAPATPDPTDTSPATDRPHKAISGDILNGDTDPDGPTTLAVTAGTFASNDGGTVTLQADGDFVFEPAASTSCTDTSDFFDYTVTDGGANGSDTGRVTMAITGCVWYVDNNDAQGNAGPSEKPFDTLTQAQAASAAGQSVFVYAGDGTGANPAFTATGGGTVVVTDPAPVDNTITTTTGTALNVTNTTIGASGLTFASISANGAPSGIVLNNTGTSGGVTVTGDSGSANNSSGGTIQNTTGQGISLSTTHGDSFDQMNIQNTVGSGVRGLTAVRNFAFTNGTINNSGTAGGNQESSIAFNDPTGSATDAKVTGTVTITGNTLTNALWHGVSILQFAGQLDDVNISNNVITSGTTTGTGGNSFGSGIQLFVDGQGTTASTVTRAELNGNTITNFPGGVLIAAQCGTANAAGPTADCGTPGSATNDIEIKNNILNGGGTAPDGAGGFIKPNQIMLLTVNGRGVGQFTVQNNGTVADPLSGSIGTSSTSPPAVPSPSRPPSPATRSTPPARTSAAPAGSLPASGPSP
jgi:hypothetical protein